MKVFKENNEQRLCIDNVAESAYSLTETYLVEIGHADASDGTQPWILEQIRQAVENIES